MSLIELSLWPKKRRAGQYWIRRGKSVLSLLIKAEKKLIITCSLLVLKEMLFILITVNYSSFFFFFFRTEHLRSKEQLSFNKNKTGVTAGEFN